MIRAAERGVKLISPPNCKFTLNQVVDDGLADPFPKITDLLKVVTHRHEHRQRSSQRKEVHNQIDDFRPGERRLFFDFSILHNLKNDVV